VKIITLCGYGIQVRVDRGHLVLEDGIGANRQQIRLSRVGHGLRRLIVIGSDGCVSLAALRWLADQGAAFVMLERTGKVLVTTGPVRPSDARLRRAQSLAMQSGMAVQIARELIRQKLIAQERVARHKLQSPENANVILHRFAHLDSASSPDAIRLIESHAAAAYWSSWRSLPITFPRKDQARIPEHWRVFGTRVSALTGSPRLAINPPNAMLNYLYAVLESEARLAAATMGLDPGVGVLHVDMPNRDSLASDLMEPVRPQVDAFLLDWITSEPLKREWFFEERNGNCRLMSSLAVHLSQTAPTWGRSVGRLAEWVAQRLWSEVRHKGKRDRSIATRLTQRRRVEGRGLEFAPREVPAPRPNKICPGCGATTRLGRNCPKCGREISRDKLIELAKSGRIVAQRPESRKKHSETLRRHHAAKQAWQSVRKRTWPDEATYIQEIQPRLASVTISSISSALGICESYAADIRAGRHRAHPRHWQNLAELAKVVPHSS
jgi:CRISPR-associated endonuclease Cas1